MQRAAADFEKKGNCAVTDWSSSYLNTNELHLVAVIQCSSSDGYGYSFRTTVVLFEELEEVGFEHVTDVYRVTMPKR